MIEKHFNTIVLVWILLAIMLFPLLIKIKAPYGRHSNKSWGLMIDNRTGWIFMELPSLLLFSFLFLNGPSAVAQIKWVFFSFWALHYVNRIFIFPFRTRTMGKKMPLMIMILTMVFNLINAFINGYWLGYMTDYRYSDWGRDPRFIAGIIIFIAGFIINQSSDNYLIKLREKKGAGYFLPEHWLFRKISCPNFGGEVLEWTGFAVMTWAMPGLSFAIWTAANLVPRALHHHRWYRDAFPDYPKNRKAIIPGIL